MAHAGSTLFGYKEESQTFHSFKTNFFGANLFGSTLSLFGTDNLMVQSIGSFGDYFYVHGNVTTTGNHVIDFYSESFHLC